MMSQVLEALLLALKNKGKKKRSEDFFRSFTSCPIRVYEKDSKVDEAAEVMKNLAKQGKKVL
ncbi:hypothetical protein PN584_09470, partial [Parabacteroides merdae]|nr:hypothetical protein [Parabacteroides merdae]